MMSDEAIDVRNELMLQWCNCQKEVKQVESLFFLKNVYVVQLLRKKLVNQQKKRTQSEDV